jgi:hypothetical protein
VLYDVKALNPMPVPSVDLRHMGPMRLSRFWSAVHDSLLYADPRAASGGRVSDGRLCFSVSLFQEPLLFLENHCLAGFEVEQSA